MPALEYTAQERAHDMAMMARSQEIYRRLRSGRPESPPTNVRSNCVAPRHPLDDVLYAVPIGPVFVPADAPEGFNPNRPKVLARDIVAECARLAGLTVPQLLVRTRQVRPCRARQFAMWRIHSECQPRSLPQIGRDLGGLDHTSALHAVRKVQRLVDDGVIDPSNPRAWFDLGYKSGNGK
ncbi:MAG: helix-turn-helix domain-containing protein [Beijerinckiaceae bacterium]